MALEKSEGTSPPVGMSDSNSHSLTISGTDHESSWRRYLVVVALLLAMFLTALDLTIVATAVPRITQEFCSIADVGWYGSSFFITFACFQSAWGKTYKYHSMKSTFLGAVAIFELGSAICGAAQNSKTVIAGRAVTGIGAGGVVGGTYTIMATIVPPAQAPAYISLIGVVFSIASVAGPLLGGLFTQAVSWRWCFYINLPVGAVALLLVLIFLKTSSKGQPVKVPAKEYLLQLDFPGLLVILASLLLFTIALQWGGVTKPWSSGLVLGPLIASVALAGTFGIIQRVQGERASIIARIVNNRNAAALCAYISLNNMTTFLLLYYLPIYFQSIGGASPAQSGVRNLSMILAMSIAILTGARLITWIRYFKPILIAGGVLLTAGAATMCTLDLNTGAGRYIGFQILLGVGNGISSQIPMITLHSFCRPEDLAPTTATVLFFQLVSGAISLAIGQSIFANRLLSAASETVPLLSAQDLLNVGADALREAFSGRELMGVLLSYMHGLKATFILGVVFAVMALGAALACEWKPANVDKGQPGQGGMA